MTRLYRRRPRKPVCSICGLVGTESTVRHFSLLRVVYKPDGRMGSRGAGSIDLCGPCWTVATVRARIRARPRKPEATPES